MTDSDNKDIVVQLHNAALECDGDFAIGDFPDMNPGLLIDAADEIERLRTDANRYRYLRDNVHSRDVDVPADFSGDVVIAPPRIETFESGIPIMTNAGQGPALDAAIDVMRTWRGK